MKQLDPLISVVIPSYNEASYIGRLLAGLAEQTYPNFEVIVSDGRSTDATPSIVKKYQNKLSLDFIESPPCGPAAQRNYGAKKAMGSWLLFIDADVDIDDKDFFRVLLDTTIKNNWKTSTTKFSVKKASLLERFGTAVDYHYIKLLRGTKHPVAPGWCILTCREIFEQSKGFNEKIQFGEDYDYVSRVGHYGFGFVDQTSYFIDLRRVHEEGFKYVYKGIANEVYRHTHKYNLEANRYGYNFGKHGDKAK